MKWYFVLNEQAHPSYFENAKVAVLSCRARTTLEPHCLWDGGETAFTAWLAANGVIVHRTQVPFMDVLENARGTRGLIPETARGAYLRMQIPEIEREDRFAFYSDCDVLFQRDPVPALVRLQPRMLAATYESEIGETVYFNSGAMLLNVEAMRSAHAAFLDYVRADAPHWVGFSANDQGALNNFFRGVWERLDPLMNWKTYWGINDHAYLVHFHGCRPHEINSFLSGGKSAKAKWRVLGHRDQTGMAYYAKRYFEALNDLYAKRSAVRDVSSYGRVLRVEVDAGEESVAHEITVIEHQVDDGPILYHEVTTPESSYAVQILGDQALVTPRVHRLRVRLRFQQGDWIERDVEGRGANAAAPSDVRSFWVADQLQAGEGPLSDTRTRVKLTDAARLRSFYVNPLAAVALERTASGVQSVRAIAETNLPKAVIPRCIVDRAVKAQVRFPDGLVLYDDGLIDRGAAESLPTGNHLISSNGKVVRVHKISARAVHDSGCLLACPEPADDFAWLGQTIARLAAFRDCAETTDLKLLTNRLTPSRKALLASLAEENVLAFEDEDVVAFDSVFVAMCASDFPAPGSPWMEALGASFVERSAVALCRGQSELTKALAARGWRVLDADAASVETMVSMLRRASLVTLLDQSLAPLLVFASASAAMQDIQTGDVYQDGPGYRWALLKRLSVGPIVLPQDLSAAEATLAVEPLWASAMTLLRSNVATSDFGSDARSRGAFPPASN